MKVYIYAMGRERKELANWIDNHTFQVMVALAQLYLFHHGTRKHWRTEVWNKFPRIYPLSNNKLPDWKFIMKNSWGKNYHKVQKALQFAKDKETDFTPQADESYDEFYQLVEDYFMWLSHTLSKVEILPQQLVLEQLDQMGLPEIVDWSN